MCCLSPRMVPRGPCPAMAGFCLLGLVLRLSSGLSSATGVTCPAFGFSGFLPLPPTPKHTGTPSFLLALGNTRCYGRAAQPGTPAFPGWGCPGCSRRRKALSWPLPAGFLAPRGLALLGGGGGGRGSGLGLCLRCLVWQEPQILVPRAVLAGLYLSLCIPFCSHVFTRRCVQVSALPLLGL